MSWLSAGIYEYTCAVSDEIDQIASDTVRVTVVKPAPETPPETITWTEINLKHE